MAKPYAANTNAMDSMRLILRWVQHDAGLPGRAKTNLDDIAEAVGISRDKLNKFLARTGNPDEMKRRHSEIAERLVPTLGQYKEIPPQIAHLLDDVYDGQVATVREDVVESPRVIAHKALIRPDEDEETRLRPLYGVSLIVRRANETVAAPREDDPDARTPGWSISILNVPPAHVMAGNHHPLFKLRQYGFTQQEVTIEGVVIAKGERITLQGLELGEGRPFTGLINANHERWKNYRPAQGAVRTDGTAIQGLMLGLSSGRVHFATIMELYALPNSVLPKGADDGARKVFDEQYERAKQVVGVHSLEAAVEKLNGLGIGATVGHLQDMRDRATQSPVLRAI